MKDYRIAYVRSGHSDYDDKVWMVLSIRYPLQRYFAKFDHLDLADCFVLAGADIRSRIEDDEVHVEIFIDPDGKSDFVTRLENLITEKYDSLIVR